MHEPPSAHDWHLLVVTGGLAAGKTSVAVEVGELVSARGEPVSVVDLDQLCWTTPAPWTGRTVGDVLHGSLTAVLPVHASAGVHLLVLPRLLRGRADLAHVVDAVRPASLLVVEVAAPDDVRAARLLARDAGSTLEGHLDEVAAMRPETGLADVVVRSDGRTVADVAREVLELWDDVRAGRRRR